MKKKQSNLVWDGRRVVNPAYIFDPGDFLQKKNVYGGLPQSFCDTDFSPLYADTSFGGDALSDLRDFGNVETAEEDLMGVYLTGTDNNCEYVEPEFVEYSAPYDEGYSDGYMGYESRLNDYLTDEDMDNYLMGYEAGSYEVVVESGAEAYDLGSQNPYEENTWEYEAWVEGYTKADEDENNF